MSIIKTLMFYENSDKKRVKTIGLLIILISVGGCSNSIPSVSALESKLTPSKNQTRTFVDANISGAKQVTTSDNYVGRFVLHSGTSGKTAKTADNYQLTLRKVSF